MEEQNHLESLTKSSLLEAFQTLLEERDKRTIAKLDVILQVSSKAMDGLASSEKHLIETASKLAEMQNQILAENRALNLRVLSLEDQLRKKVENEKEGGNRPPQKSSEATSSNNRHKNSNSKGSKESQEKRRARLEARGRVFGPRPDWATFPEKAEVEGRTLRFLTSGLFRRTKEGEVLVRDSDGDWWLWLPGKKEFKRSPGKHIAKKDNIIQFWIKRKNAREKRENRRLEGFTRKRKRPEKEDEIRRNEKNSTLPPTAIETKGVEAVSYTHLTLPTIYSV
eukprot:TRINITY_DN3376_c0_g3_i4.p1 TRINITY_DN3376_c0_g3~~TRINITY_DN3376_c0_g3_i4.p1  ORF type:complete len:281 (+),score=43.77 TRINITY_DN3376_c0_g3_i4:138-980(+)